MWFLRFRQIFTALLLPWLVAVVIQSGGRIYLLIAYGSSDALTGFSQDIMRMFWTGMLFDIRIASLLFVPCLLIAGIIALNNRGFYLWQSFWPWLATFLSLVITTLTVVNVFYYATFDRFIDIFVFGLVEDDTIAVLTTLWSDYPVIRVLFSLSIFAVMVFFAYRYWQRWLNTRQVRDSNLPVSTIITLTILLVCLAGMRGSLGTFPLRQDDAQVSEIKLLNMLTPNGLIALDWAFKAHTKSNHFAEATDQEGARLLSRFLQRPVPASLQPFMATTDVNPTARENPPHVVLAVMESMGYDLASYDRSDRDLYAALRQHWQSDWRFDRFISEGDGTIDSLSRFFVRSPMSTISQSSAQTTDFASNMFKPFLANGYKIIFVTSGNGAWHNINQFLPRLGVSEFIEQNGLKKRYPSAQTGTWGVPDEYMFRYMAERLEEADKKGEHIFIMSMSTTHHPPYRTPPGYNKTDFHLTDTEKKRLKNLASGDELQEVLNTLRYSNDQLGQFISRVKDSHSSGSHTIIAATGDHNIRSIGYPDPQERVLGHAVPFYIYVPMNYRHNSYFDANRVGSHKDILPTLYQLSLSETEYYRTGCNLLATSLDNTWCQGYNPEVVITPEGACMLKGKTEFRPWKTQNGLLLGTAAPMNSTQEKLCHRWGAFTDLLWWQLNRQVQNESKKTRRESTG
ncbi:sulfatase-like hydrolase/transferase [Erwiniaceae bacterium BAC15a-03b]|uniref:Sulfatase-like hydrolase/transferase n=1 Tax=Winslowiella arboricola TaxID=2978220 RepID=A0A9J6PEX0_9GAMM|nr:alkaline phosphatase family protein [Winslowiella arboricola]MCU5774226.1 sulfatase-like hydrolase/transferase [Winslowiella arboricola]MCU5776841.1 sulfatase-like hydrolase/transferase [Winslowiella arboricola]